MTHEELGVLAGKLADVAKAHGARGAIIALSIEDGGHSYWAVRVRGPCIELEGLSSHIPPTLAALWPEPLKVSGASLVGVGGNSSAGSNGIGITGRV